MQVEGNEVSATAHAFDAFPADIELDTPPLAKCSSKYPSVLLVGYQGSACDVGTALNFYQENLCDSVVLCEQPMKWIKWLPWPPPTHIEEYYIADMRPIPRRSFSSGDGSVYWEFY